MKDKMGKNSLEIADLGEGVVHDLTDRSTPLTTLDLEMETQPWSKKLLRKIDWQ